MGDKRSKVWCGLMAGLAVLFLAGVFPLWGQDFKGEFKMGHTTCLSGTGAPWGIALKRGFEMAAEDINAAGGVLVKGQRLKFVNVVYDDGYVISKAQANAHRLITQDNVKYLSVTGSAPTLAIQPITEPKKIILNSYSSGLSFLKPSNYYTFKPYFTATETPAVMYPFLKRTAPDFKTVALMNPDDESGWECSDSSRKVIQSVGGYKIVANVFTDRTVADLYPVLTGVLAKKPDIIDAGITPAGQFSVLVKVARESGFKGPIFTLEVFLSSLFKVAGEKAAEGVLLNMFPAPPTDLAKKISDKYRSIYGEEMTPLAMQHYQAAWFIKAAVEKADSTETERVMPAMEKLEFRDKSVYGGTLKLSGRDIFGIDRRISMSMAISKIVNGKLELQEIAEMLPGF